MHTRPLGKAWGLRYVTRAKTAQRDRPENDHRGGRDWKAGLRKARSINSGSSACQTGTPVQRKRWKRDSVTCLCYLLFCWFGFSSFVGLVSRLNVAFFVFAAFIASGNLFLFADVVGWLVLLAAGLFCAPGCLVGSVFMALPLKAG